MPKKSKTPRQLCRGMQYRRILTPNFQRYWLPHEVATFSGMPPLPLLVETAGVIACEQTPQRPNGGKA